MWMQCLYNTIEMQKSGQLLLPVNCLSTIFIYMPLDGNYSVFGLMQLQSVSPFTLSLSWQFNQSNLEAVLEGFFLAKCASVHFIRGIQCFER